MLHKINVANKKEAINLLTKYKNKDYGLVDIAIANVNLTALRDKDNKQIFQKRDLYVNSRTLFEIMLPLGQKGSHNSHGLTPEEVLYALSTIQFSHSITTTDDKIFVVVTLCIANCNDVIIAIIEKHCSIKNKLNANVNKLITMYPKKGMKKPKEAKKCST